MHRSTRTRAILALVLLIAPWVTYAGIEYSHAPLVIDEVLEPRDIKEHTFTLENTGDIPVTIYPTVNNISVDDGGRIQEFLPPSMSDKSTSLASWLEIKRSGIDLKGGESTTVVLTIRVSPVAVPGSYHAFVSFPYGGNRDEAERKLARGEAPGTVISVTIDENKQTFLKLSRFLVDRFVTRSENSAATYVVRNPGETPIVPSGEVIIYNSKGEEVGAFPVNPEHVTIAPGAEQSFASPVPTEGLFGKYKAFLTVDYGLEQRASINDTTFFYVFPMKMMLAIAGVFVLVVGIVSFFIHRRYFDESIDDGSEYLPVHVRPDTSDPKHHDIDLRTP